MPRTLRMAVERSWVSVVTFLDTVQPVRGGDAGARPRRSEPARTSGRVSRGAWLERDVDCPRPQLCGCRLLLAWQERKPGVRHRVRDRTVSEYRQSFRFSSALPLFSGAAGAPTQGAVLGNPGRFGHARCVHSGRGQPDSTV